MDWIRYFCFVGFLLISGCANDKEEIFNKEKEFLEPYNRKIKINHLIDGETLELHFETYDFWTGPKCSKSFSFLYIDHLKLYDHFSRIQIFQTDSVDKKSYSYAFEKRDLAALKQTFGEDKMIKKMTHFVFSEFTDIEFVLLDMYILEYIKTVYPLLKEKDFWDSLHDYGMACEKDLDNRVPFLRMKILVSLLNKENKEHPSGIEKEKVFKLLKICPDFPNINSIDETLIIIEYNEIFQTQWEKPIIEQ